MIKIKIDLNTISTSSRPAKRIRLLFRDPITFQTREDHSSFVPLPEELFRALAQRWNTLCDLDGKESLRINEDALISWVVSHVYMSSFDIEGDRAGVRGMVVYSVSSPDDHDYGFILEDPTAGEIRAHHLKYCNTLDVLCTLLIHIKHRVQYKLKETQK